MRALPDPAHVLDLQSVELSLGAGPRVRVRCFVLGGELAECEADDALGVLLGRVDALRALDAADLRLAMRRLTEDAFRLLRREHLARIGLQLRGDGGGRSRECDDAAHADCGDDRCGAEPAHAGRRHISGRTLTTSTWKARRGPSYVTTSPGPWPSRAWPSGEPVESTS